MLPRGEHRDERHERERREPHGEPGRHRLAYRIGRTRRGCGSVPSLLVLGGFRGRRVQVAHRSNRRRYHQVPTRHETRKRSRQGYPVRAQEAQQCREARPKLARAYEDEGRAARHDDVQPLPQPRQDQEEHERHGRSPEGRWHRHAPNQDRHRQGGRGVQRRKREARNLPQEAARATGVELD